jgi:hypothetical protein
MQIFRQGLLEDSSIALSGAVPAELRGLLRSLGARLHEPDPELASDDGRMSAWARATAPLDVLICTEGTGEDGSLARTWATVRGVAAEAFIPRGKGRIILLAPPHDAVAAAGLENLARTLSVEWARFGVITVAIAPNAAATDEHLAQLVAFLCSPAGAYYSGCRLDLGSVRPAPEVAGDSAGPDAPKPQA